MRLAMVAALGALVGACTTPPGPQGQLVLYFDTDAPLADPAQPDSTALFDSLRVEIFEPGSAEPCAKCTRTFGLDAAQVKERRASIGILTRPHTTGYRVRARLWWSGAGATDEPPPLNPDGSPPSSVIEVVVSLPPIDDEGIVSQWILLPTDAVGLPVGTLDSPVATNPGQPPESKVGTWWGARAVPCAGDPNDGEVCVPGGAFWMGNPHVAPIINSVQGKVVLDEADKPRLVVLSPFFLGATEVTVGDMRNSKVRPELLWSGSSAGDAWLDFCTFTPSPASNEQLPVNCISFARSRAYCQTLGADLPTEAQFEYVAGALRSKLYAWGEDTPAPPPDGCAEAVLGRGGWGIAMNDASQCKPAAAPGGTLAVGSTVPSRRDRTLLPGKAVVHDLVGNVGERTLDVFDRADGPCWSGGGVFVDPLCTQGSNQHTIRGGSWLDNARYATAAARHTATDNLAAAEVGLRCARSAAP
jgi:formylglycine-generating enzyme required for sulfatase activity